jgi:hypothetical protein
MAYIISIQKSFLIKSNLFYVRWCRSKKKEKWTTYLYTIFIEHWIVQQTKLNIARGKMLSFWKPKIYF